MTTLIPQLMLVQMEFLKYSPFQYLPSISPTHQGHGVQKSQALRHIALLNAQQL
jgi:hypothetical protein